VDVAGLTDVGLERSHNEDAFIIADLTSRSVLRGERASAPHLGGRVLLALSDGLGGHPGGELASAVVVETMTHVLLDAHEDVPREELLDHAVHLAHQSVRDAARSTGKIGMGATLTAVLIDGMHAYVSEVGDSRAYLLRGDELMQLTHDQSMVQMLVDQGQLDEADARTFPFRNVVLQTMGQAGMLRTPLRKLQLRRGDRVLLCSDGLTELVADDEIGQIVARAASPDIACTALVDLANLRGGVDNITVVVAAVSGGLPRPSRSENVAHTLETLKSYVPRYRP
jgi:serine/threonine protein phosphatase PrpC